MNLGHTLQCLRKKRGLSGKDIETATGITATYLSMVEGNRKEPTLRTLRLLADAIGVPLPVLMFLTLDEADVPGEKRELFGQVWPSVREMVETFFCKKN